MELDDAALLGKGGYGCTFTPPLPCRKSKSKLKKEKSRVVSKVMMKSEAEIELNIATVVKGIPGYQRYYIVPEEVDNCDSINFKKIKETYTRLCPLFRDIKDTDMYQILSRYGGKSLKGVAITESFDFVHSFKHVLEGIAKLNNQGICHLDIKQDNLLVDMYGTIRIIDFGISFLGDLSNEETVKEHKFPFLPEYDGFPPELTVMNGLVKKMDLHYAIQQTIQEKEILIKAASLLGLNLQKQQQFMREYWLQDEYHLQGTDKAWAKWFQATWKVWDSWAVGVVFLKLLQKCLLIPSFIQTTWANDKEKIKLVLKGLLQANPTMRLTAEEALSILDA